MSGEYARLAETIAAVNPGMSLSEAHAAITRVLNAFGHALAEVDEADDEGDE